MKSQNQTAFSQREIFLNSVPILNSLNKEERVKIAEAFKEKTFSPGTEVMKEGERGEEFFIILEVIITEKAVIAFLKYPAYPRSSCVLVERSSEAS